MQQQNHVYLVVEALRNTRDADTNLHGLNQLRRAVGSTDGLSFLQEYLAHTQGFDDLQHIWDAQVKVQNYHVTVTLLLALSDILSLAATLSQQQQKQRSQEQHDDDQARQLKTAAAALAQAIHSRRMKALYFNLSSEIRGKANAALTLLAALVSQGPDITREIARVFDFSLAALPALARLPRQHKGDGREGGQEGLQAQLWQQWRGSDVLKRPTRAAYVAFALGMLRNADPITLGTLLATRPFMGGLLNHMAGDPPEIQLQVLGTLRSRVLSSKAGVSAATQAEVLSEMVLSQLSQLAVSSAADADVAAEPMAGDEAQQAADLAFQLLKQIATDPSHGLCFGGPGWVTLTDAVVAQLTPGQKRLLRWLQRLRPAESAAHIKLLKACTAADPSLAVALLLSLPFFLEPSATGRWVVHAAVTGELLQQAASLPVGLSRLAEGGGRPPGMDSKIMLGLLRCAVPACLSKAALSRGLQHSSTLVRHATLCLMARVLDITSALVKDIVVAAEMVGRAGSADVAFASSSTPAATSAGHFRELGRAIQAAVRAALPDPQPVLAIYSSLERGGAGKAAIHEGPVANEVAAGSAADEDEGVMLNISEGEREVAEKRAEEAPTGSVADGKGEERKAQKGGLATANPLLVSAVLRVLVGWQRALPGALAEANVDAERLLPQDLGPLEPQQQYLFMELLLASHPTTTTAATAEGPALGSTFLPLGTPSHTHSLAVPLPLPAALLLPVLRLLCEAQNAEVCQLAWRWAQARLAASGAFGDQWEEPHVWLSLLPRGAGHPSGPAVCRFLSDALMQVQRRPHEFFELAQQSAARDDWGDIEGSIVTGWQCSLLALCALRQALRVLPSSKMVPADKAAITAYVVAVLCTLQRQQHSTHSTSDKRVVGARRFARFLLDVLRFEAQRGAQQGTGTVGGNDVAGLKRRKGESEGGHGKPVVLALPAEGQCIASLASLLEQEWVRPSSSRAAPVLDGAHGGEEGQHSKKRRRVSKGQAASLESQASALVVITAADSSIDAANGPPVEQLLCKLAEHAQQAAWELRHQLLTIPRSKARAVLLELVGALPAAANLSCSSSKGRWADGLPVVASLVAGTCLAHNLPLPLPGGIELDAQRARAVLLGAAPIDLLLHTLMTTTASGCGSKGRGTGNGSDAALENSGFEREGQQARAAELLAAVQRRVRAGAEEGEWEDVSAVVRQCLFWLERAENTGQVQLLFQAMQSALSLYDDLHSTAQQAQQRQQQHQATALDLLATHPYVRASLEAATCSNHGRQQAAEAVDQKEAKTALQSSNDAADCWGSDAAALSVAVAVSTVELLRQQLSQSKSMEFSTRIAASAPLLQVVASAFLNAVQAGKVVSRRADKGKKSGAGKNDKKGRQQAAAETRNSDTPPAAYHWLELLPWMGSAEVESVSQALLETIDRSLTAPELASWAVTATVCTLHQLLSRHSMIDASMLHTSCGLLIQLVSSSQHSAADDCLAALLCDPRILAALAFLNNPSPAGTEQEGLSLEEVSLVGACLKFPSPSRARILLALVQRSCAARHCFSHLLPSLLHPATTAKKSGSKPAGAAHDGIVLLACCLPAAVTILHLACGSSTADVGGEAASWQQEAADLSACLRGPLLAFFAGRRSGGVPAATPFTAVGKGERTARAFAMTEVAALLRSHALPCLQLCLQLQALDEKEREQILDRLLTPKGFPLDPISLELDSAHVGSATSADRAQVAMLLLEGAQSQRSGKGVRWQPGAALLLRYLQTYAPTLAALFKLPALSPAQLQLEELLMCHLDGTLGDAVAALQAQQRRSQDFSRLADAACGFAMSVLRFRFADVAAMRTLRRFMAALLPDDAESAGGDGDVEEAEPSSRAAKAHPRSGSSSSDSSSSHSPSDDDEPGTQPVNSESERDHGARATDHVKPIGHADSSASPSNPSVAAAALQLLQRLVTHSRFVPAMRAVAASPPSLPPAAQAIPRPLQSLLPLAELPDEVLVAADITGCASNHARVNDAEARQAAGVKKELCELLETLLDLQEQYSRSDAQSLRRVQQAAAALLPLLMAGYGASLSPTDCAVWSLARSINHLLWQRAQQAAAPTAAMQVDSDSSEDSDGSREAVDGEQGEDVDREAVAALLNGSLAETGFAWGPAAAAVQASGGEEESSKLLQAKLPIDPFRCSLTAVHFPEWRTLTGRGTSVELDREASSSLGSDSIGHCFDAPLMWQGATTGGSGLLGGTRTRIGQAAPPVLPHAEAGYDPAFLLPFCVTALRRRLVPARVLMQAGVLSLCLRALAAADAALRGLAYEAVSLFQEQLDEEEFREKQQLSVLLTSLRNAITAPFRRLPAVHALLCAEAALVLLHAGAPMYQPINKYLLKRAVLDIKEVPLFAQLMLGGSPQHAAERRWLLQLLLGGLRWAEDARLYRRQYVLEMAMSLHDSPVADPQAALLAIRLVCRASYVPRAAQQLTEASGLIPWLTAAATRTMRANHHVLGSHTHAQALHDAPVLGSTSAPPASTLGAWQQAAKLQQPGCLRSIDSSRRSGEAMGPLQPAQEALAALLRLSKLRVVVRPGAKEALQDFAAAALQLAAVLGITEECREALQPSALPPSVASGAQPAQQKTRCLRGVGEEVEGLRELLLQLLMGVQGLSQAKQTHSMQAMREPS